MENKIIKPDGSKFGKVVFFSLSLMIMFFLLLLIKSLSNQKEPASNSNLEQSPKELTATSIEEVFETEDSKKFTFNDQEFIAFIFDSRKHDLSFFYKNDEGKMFNNFNTINKSLKTSNSKLRFATNAGIFKPNNKPVGLFIEEGKTITPLNLKGGQGNFYLKPNGVFFITKEGIVKILESQEYSDLGITPKFATQSGPLLIKKDTIHHAFNEGSPNLFIRNGVGIISQHKAVFIISKKPVNLFDFSSVFKEQFGCKDALYLDGAISEMYLPEKGMKEGDQFFSVIIGVTENQ